MKKTPIFIRWGRTLSRRHIFWVEKKVNIVVFLSNLVGSAWVTSISLIQESELQDSDVPVSEAVAAGTSAPEKLQELSETLNQTQAVQDVSAGILEPIYSLAQYMALPSFYWVAFAIMVAGVVSFAGQLVFTKLFLLFKLNLNVKEILSDLLGLVVSLTGLVLTTQAATQNSTFPENSVAVVSATVVGGLLGFVFYLWGQKQEFQAARRDPKADRE